MLTVIGCGNPNRRDDGVGVRLAQRLRERLERHPVPGVRAYDCGTAGMEVMFAARGSSALLVIDASQTGSEPGAVYDVPGEELEELPEPSFNLHDFRWQHALAAGRKIYGEQMPSDVRVWLIEAASTDLGLELSEPVADAMDRVFARLLEHVAEHAAGRHAVANEPVEIRRGFLKVPRALFDRVFDGRDGAVLAARDGALHVMPVEQLAGGVLVKMRNAAGDRSIDVTEPLRQLGWDEVGTLGCRASWDRAMGTLALRREGASEEER